MPHDEPGHRPALGFAAVVIVVIALNLRIAIAAISPVLDQVSHDLKLSSAVAGLLTTTPVICFGAFAFVVPALRRSFGVEALLVIESAVLVAGILLRLLPGVEALFAGTIVIGAAIAVGNVLLPAIIKRDFPGRTSLLTGLYSMCLSGGAALSAGLTVPLERALGVSWRAAVGAWVVPAALALVLAVVRAVTRRPARREVEGPSGVVRVGGLWRDRIAWAVTGFMGLQSLGFYAILAWLPTVFESHHLSAAASGWLLSYSNFPAIGAALVAPMLSRRLGRPRVVLAVAALLSALGFVLLAEDPVRFDYLATTVLGLGQGASVSLALSYIVLRAPDTEHSAQLSTMAQGVGYLVASLGPLLLGVVHDATDGWQVPLLVLAALVVPQLFAGLVASADRHVRRAELDD